MKNVVAVICEYNPFHSGHLYQLNELKKELSPDGIICIMSGNFTQRAEPAVLSKWKRAEMAVKCGADLVLELPVCFAAQSAERFARGGVSLADRLGVVTHLAFGSENGDINKLKDVAEFLIKNKDDVEFKKHYQKGLSYPAARQMMVEALSGSEMSEIIKLPNDILAIEYIAALKLLNSNIEPFCIKRKGVMHNESGETEGFASSSYIRECLKRGEDVEKLMPKAAFDVLTKEKGDIVLDKAELSACLTYILRTKEKDELKNILDMAEGLENRFATAGKNFSTISEISEFVKSKRFTKTRIDRIILNMILKIDSSYDFKKCEYARVLALNSVGASILARVKQRSNIPIITKMADATLSGDALKMLSLDVLATDIYSLLTNDKKSGKDFTNSPVFVC